MAKRKKPVIGQLGLFPGIVKPQKTPEQAFTEKLYKAGLISATVKRKWTKKGSPKTINVKKRVAEATAVLQNAKGVNLKVLQTILKSKKRQTLKSVLESGVVAGIKRSPEEQKKMKAALNVIIYFVNRKKDSKNNAKKFAPSVEITIENVRQKRHLEDIGRE